MCPILEATDVGTAVRKPGENMFTVENTASIEQTCDALDNNQFHFEGLADYESFDEAQMSDYLDSMSKQMASFKLNHDTKNSIFKIIRDMPGKILQFNEHMINADNGMNSLQSLQFATGFITNKLSQFCTRHKRDKILQNELYVAPQELAMGVRWHMVKESNSSTAIPRLIQNKFQMMPLTHSIVTLFRRDDFAKEYRLHNSRRDNILACNGSYKDFTSGSNFKKNELFQQYPNSIQIELAQDDFEVCDALGSKSTINKLCPFYFTVKNMPRKFNSKLNQILLASLCYTDDLVTEYTSIDDIWRVLVADIKCLENGIDIGNGEIIRGTVIYVAADNLGANSIFGLVKSFFVASVPVLSMKREIYVWKFHLKGERRPNTKNI